MNFSCRDTIYYYRVDGKLRQALSIIIENFTGEEKNGVVIVEAPGFETIETKIQKIKRGVHTYTVYAPLTYPRFDTIFDSQVGRHRPVRAIIALSIDGHIERRNALIGTHRPWTIYVCQDVCSDFTWGYNEEETINLSIALTDAQIHFIDSTDNEPSGSKNRWNFNQAMDLEWYIERKGPDDIKKLFSRAHEGRVSISPIYNSCLTACMSTEQAIRALYFARKLEREHAIDISVAEHIEVPTIAWGMAMILAGSGITHLVKGWFDFQAPYCVRRDDVPLFYWEGPDGSRILTAMDKGASLIGNYAQARFLQLPYGDAMRDLDEIWIPHFEARTDYPYDAFVLLGSHGDLSRDSANQIQQPVSNISKFNQEGWEFPRLVNATWRQFFDHIKTFIREHGISPPVLRGDYGSSWEEWPAHLAAVFSEVRRGVERFIVAEKLTALVGTLDSRIFDLNHRHLETSQTLMLKLAEHPWNGSREEEKIRAFKRKMNWQNELNKKVDEVINSAFDCLSQKISNGKEASIMVFNSLSWQRTDTVEVSGLAQKPKALIDIKSGEIIRCETSRKGDDVTCRFIAREVPPLGYRTYAPAESSKPCETFVSIRGNVIENKFYRVKVDEATGGIKSIFDKRLNVELVDTKSTYKLNQYVYLSDGSEYTANCSTITRGFLGDVSGSIIVESSALMSKIRSIITLYSEIDRIDIENDVKKTPSSEPTQIHFAFPFNVPNRVYHYESNGAILRPGLSQYGGEQLMGSGQCIHSARSFVDVSNENYGVIMCQVDSYLLQFGHHTSFEIPTEPDLSNSTVLSLVMTNRCHEMLADQGGISNFRFRYSIKGHRGGHRGSDSVRLGWEVNNPLLGNILTLERRGPLPEVYSFLSCHPANVVVTAYKVCEEGPERGFIIRVWETEGRETEAEIDVSKLDVDSAWRTDLLERDIYELAISDGKLKVKVPARGMATLRVKRRA